MSGDPTAPCMDATTTIAIRPGVDAATTSNSAIRSPPCSMQSMMHGSADSHDTLTSSPPTQKSATTMTVTGEQAAPTAILHRDALQSIFAFVELSSLPRCLSVCCQWRNAERTSKTRQEEMKLSSDEQLWSLLESPLRRHISGLSCWAPIDVNPDGPLEGITRSLSNLTSLRFDWILGPQLAMPTLPPNLRRVHLRMLLHIDFGFATREHELTGAIACVQSVCNQCPSIEEIELSLCSQVGRTITLLHLPAVVIQKLGSLPLLHSLSYASSTVEAGIIGPPTPAQTHALLSLTSLRCLNLNQRLFAPSIERLALVRASTLQKLSMLPANFGDQEARALSKLTQLTECDLWTGGGKLSEGKLDAMLAALPNLTLFAMLSPTIDIGALRHCAMLTDLRLGGHNVITDARLCAVMPFLSRLQSIKLVAFDALTSLAFLRSSTTLPHTLQHLYIHARLVPQTELSALEPLAELRSLHLLIGTVDEATLVCMNPNCETGCARHRWPKLISFKYTNCVAPPPPASSPPAAPVRDSLVLDDDVLGLTFAFLAPSDLALRVLPVCARWSRAEAKGGSSGLTLSISKEASSVINQLPSLQLRRHYSRVEFAPADHKPCRDIGLVLDAVARTMAGVTSLDFAWTMDFSSPRSRFPALPARLQSLNLGLVTAKEEGFDDTLVVGLAEHIVAHAPNLTSLSGFLYHNRANAPTRRYAPAAAIGALAGLRHLRSIKFGPPPCKCEVPLCDDAAARLDAVRSLPALTSLQIDSPWSGTWTTAELSHFVRTPTPKLKHWPMRNWVTPKKAVHVLQVTTLERLDLPAANLRELEPLIAGLPNLTHLQLSGSYLPVDAISSCARLKWLDVWDHAILDHRMIDVALALPHLRKIRSITATAVGVARMDSMVEAVEARALMLTAAESARLQPLRRAIADLRTKYDLSASVAPAPPSSPPPPPADTVRVMTPKPAGLSDDALGVVFSFLSMRDLATAVCACKAWIAAEAKCRAWQITLDWSPETTLLFFASTLRRHVARIHTRSTAFPRRHPIVGSVAIVEHAYRLMPQLLGLEVDWPIALGSIVTPDLPAALRSLDISFAVSVDAGGVFEDGACDQFLTRFVQQLVHQTPQLTSLTLTGSGPLYSLVIVPATAIVAMSGLQQLHTLQIDHPSAAPLPQRKARVDAIRELPSLRRLLNNSAWTDGELAWLTRDPPPALEFVSTHWPFEVAQARLVTRLLQTLTELDLGGLDLRPLEEMLTQLPRLRILVISLDYLPLETLRQCTALEDLSVSCLQLTDPLMIDVVLALPRLKTLRTVDDTARRIFQFVAALVAMVRELTPRAASASAQALVRLQPLLRALRELRLMVVGSIDRRTLEKWSADHVAMSQGDGSRELDAFIQQQPSSQHPSSLPPPASHPPVLPAPGCVNCVRSPFGGSAAGEHVPVEAFAALSRICLARPNDVEHYPPPPPDLPTLPSPPCLRRSLHLHRDVLCCMFTFLDLRSLARCMAVCPQWISAEQQVPCRRDRFGWSSEATLAGLLDSRLARHVTSLSTRRSFDPAFVGLFGRLTLRMPQLESVALPWTIHAVKLKDDDAAEMFEEHRLSLPPRVARLTLDVVVVGSLAVELGSSWESAYRFPLATLMRSVASQCSALEQIELSLSSPGTTHAVCPEAIDELRDLPRLMSLHLACSKGCVHRREPVFSAELIDAIRSIKALKRFTTDLTWSARALDLLTRDPTPRLDAVPLTYAADALCVQRLSRLAPTLMDLGDLELCYVTAPLEPLLRQCTRLTKLRVVMGSADDALAIAHCMELEELSLRGGPKVRLFSQLLCAILPALTKLRHLELLSNHIKDFDFLNSAPRLTQTLLRLDLRAPNATATAISFLPSLKSLTQLRLVIGEVHPAVLARMNPNHSDFAQKEWPCLVKFEYERVVAPTPPSAPMFAADAFAPSPPPPPVRPPAIVPAAFVAARSKRSAPPLEREDCAAESQSRLEGALAITAQRSFSTAPRDVLLALYPFFTFSEISVVMRTCQCWLRAESFLKCVGESRLEEWHCDELPAVLRSRMKRHLVAIRLPSLDSATLLVRLGSVSALHNLRELVLDSWPLLQLSPDQLTLPSNLRRLTLHCQLNWPLVDPQAHSADENVDIRSDDSLYRDQLIATVRHITSSAPLLESFSVSVQSLGWHPVSPSALRELVILPRLTELRVWRAPEEPLLEEIQGFRSLPALCRLYSEISEFTADEVAWMVEGPAAAPQWQIVHPLPQGYTDAQMRSCVGKLVCLEALAIGRVKGADLPVFLSPLTALRSIELQGRFFEDHDSVRSLIVALSGRPLLSRLVLLHSRLTNTDLESLLTALVGLTDLTLSLWETMHGGYSINAIARAPQLTQLNLSLPRNFRAGGLAPLRTLPRLQSLTLTHWNFSAAELDHLTPSTPTFLALVWPELSCVILHCEHIGSSEIIHR